MEFVWLRAVALLPPMQAPSYGNVPTISILKSALFSNVLLLNLVASSKFSAWLCEGRTVAGDGSKKVSAQLSSPSSSCTKVYGGGAAVRGSAHRIDVASIPQAHAGVDGNHVRLDGIVVLDVDRGVVPAAIVVNSNFEFKSSDADACGRSKVNAR